MSVTRSQAWIFLPIYTASLPLAQSRVALIDMDIGVTVLSAPDTMKST